jgi:hypothetical protein
VGFPASARNWSAEGGRHLIRRGWPFKLKIPPPMPPRAGQNREDSPISNTSEKLPERSLPGHVFQSFRVNALTRLRRVRRGRQDTGSSFARFSARGGFAVELYCSFREGFCLALTFAVPLYSLRIVSGRRGASPTNPAGAGRNVALSRGCPARFPAGHESRRNGDLCSHR